MNKILSILLVSALVISATASLSDTTKFIGGFSSALNVTDPAFEACRKSADEVYQSFIFIAEMLGGEVNGDDMEKAAGDFGYKAAHTIRVCGNDFKDLKSFFDVVGTDLKTIDVKELGNRLFANMFALNMKFVQLKAAYDQGDFHAAGQIFADLYKTIIYGDNQRTIRQLSVAETLKSQVNFDTNATYLGVRGFLEEANTTIAPIHFDTFTTDGANLIAQAQALQAAIQKMDFAAILAALNDINNAIMMSSADFNILKGDTIAFVERDLPLFNTPEKIQKVSQYLFANLPACMMAASRVVNAYKAADYKEVGHGAGGIYNLLRTAAMA